MTMTENCFTSKKMAAVIGGPRTSFLDHLVPLCDLLNIPLVCTDEWVYHAAKIFYPETFAVIEAKHNNFQKTLSDYEIFFTVEPCRLHEKALQFGEFLYRGDAKTVAGFHGNSDKFRSSYWIERYLHEDLILLYGAHSVDFFKEKGIWQRIKKALFIGNLRLLFYQKHRQFFENKIKNLFSSSSYERVILYAPSWSFAGSEDDGTFFESYPYVLNDIPTNTKILVKLHPYMFRLFPEKVATIKETYRHCDQILFLDEIPLVYPLLFQADIYLGDYSSVGYDFLALNRPLFFLGAKQDKIQTAGHVITDLKQLYRALEEKDLYAHKRKELYEYAFIKTTLEEIRVHIQGYLE